MDEPIGSDEELLAAIVDDLASTLSIPSTAVEVERVERVTWRDGSLGCPEPGVIYSQMLVDGFRIIVGAAGQTYDYRVGRGGTFRRCDEPLNADLVQPWDDSRQ